MTFLIRSTAGNKVIATITADNAATAIRKALRDYPPQARPNGTFPRYTTEAVTSH